MGDGEGAESYRLVEYALLTGCGWLWMVIWNTQVVYPLDAFRKWKKS
jgi:hypothetical protein